MVDFVTFFIGVGIGAVVTLFFLTKLDGTL